MTIRSATPEDLTAVYSIACANPTAPQWTFAQYAEILQPQPGTTVKRMLLVGHGADGITGFAVVSALATVYPVQAELESIAVHPDRQRQGIGRALLAAVLAWCARECVAELHLEVRVSNTNAILLYEQAGLRTEGIRPGYYERPTEDAMCMICNTFSEETLPQR